MKSDWLNTSGYHLAADSQIVDQEFRDFENGIVKLINKELTFSEKIAIKPFESDIVYMPFSVGEFAEVLKAKKQN